MIVGNAIDIFLIWDVINKSLMSHTNIHTRKRTHRLKEPETLFSANGE